MNVDMDIESNLTTKERKIIEIVLNVIHKRTPNTVARLCGGWVRDKLLKQPSDDMDFMVDNISGEAFAKLIVEELGLGKDPHVIRENPDKTKNIEAAKMYVPIDGQEVELDFVQARSEEYGSNRRDVKIKQAPAEEDAMRRDLTIGALFYNLNEKKIEDFTGKGIKDLITGTIRTPYDNGDISSLDAVKKTFIEDPLRVFRAIRFATKYNGQISPATLGAMQDKDVIDAIFHSERKIAKDRIGKEFAKMLGGPNPNVALKILKDTGLFQYILNESIKGTEYENELEPLDMEQNNAHHELSVWGHTYQVLTNLLKYFPQEDEEKRIVMILGALTHDLGKLYRKIHGESKSKPGTTSYHGHENESEKICQYLMGFLEFNNNMTKQVAGLARYHMQPHTLNREEGSMSTIRKFIRRMGEQNLNWLDVFNLSVADAYSKGLNIKPETIEAYNGLRAKLEEALSSMKLQDSGTKIKPVLDGNQIMSILNTKGGPHMSVVTNYIKEIMDASPNISAEEMTNRLKEIRTQAEAIVQNNPKIKIEQAIMDILQSQPRTAEANIRTVNAATCPQHLFNKKYNDVHELIKSGKSVEALANIKELIKDYGTDYRVARMTAISLLNILSKEPKLRDNEILQYALDQTEHSLYDPILTSYSTGLLLLLKTITEPSDILKMGSKVAEMSPGILRMVLDALPNEVYHNEIKAKLKSAIEEK